MNYEKYGRSTASAQYFLQLAGYLGIPVIAWNADNSGLERVSSPGNTYDFSVPSPSSSRIVGNLRWCNWLISKLQGWLHCSILVWKLFTGVFLQSMAKEIYCWWWNFEQQSVVIYCNLQHTLSLHYIERNNLELNQLVIHE